MSLRPAEHSDLPDLLALEGSFPAGERWNESLWTEELDAESRSVVVALDGDEIVGAATFSTIAETTDLNRIVVAPEHRRRGVAAALLADGISRAGALGAERMLLEVRHDNRAAIAFYTAQGFTRIAERADYYAPGAHAVVMELPLEGDQA